MFTEKLRTKATLASVVLAFALSLLATACGGDPCDDTDCDFGVCEEGSCVNPGSCEAQSDCLPGYTCQEGACRALQACSANDDCPVGACSDGVCVNPDSCIENSDCLETTYCAESGQCEPDPCNEVTCEDGGICERGTTECVSAGSCNEQTEEQDCVGGERCYQGTCQSREDLCASLDCTRGVCSFEDKACVSADDCEGEDSQCLEGEICSDADECIPDLCIQNDVTCDNGGVCLPRVGECQNAESCASNDDCLDDHLCVDGTCSLESTACGPGDGNGGCFGAQTCVYNAGELTATCVEPSACETSLDCTGDRQCGGESCLEPVACQNDNFEPNDSESEAVPFEEAAVNQAVQAELCGGDVDVYTFNTQDFEPFTIRGTLFLSLDYAVRDQGLGEVEIELLKQQPDDSFEPVTTASSGLRGRDGAAVIERSLSAAEQGVYMVRVTGVDDVSSAGISYTLSAHLINERGVDACAAATEIATGQTASGDMSTASSTQFGASCTSVSNENPEQIYYFTLDEPSRVNITAAPTVLEEDISFSLRSECLASHTELACVNDDVEGPENLSSRLLDPGTYYIIVEAAPGATLSTYEVSVSATAANCSDASSYCEDATVSNFCPDGGGLQTADCQNGCDPTTGRCFRVDGDLCRTATEIAPGATETIEWNQYFNDYNVPIGGCVPESNGSTETGGGRPGVPRRSAGQPRSACDVDHG